jgi:thiosulfate reductase cytochrome b subunit
MKAATERKLIRWIHLLLSIPIIGFIYGPVADIPRAAFATLFVFVPVVILSGLWLWKGHCFKKQFRLTRKS